AVAMGAEVTVLSQTTSKRDDSLRFGAVEHYATVGDEGRETLRGLRGTFDVILNTVSANLPVDRFLATLKPRGARRDRHPHRADVRAGGLSRRRSQDPHRVHDRRHPRDPGDARVLCASRGHRGLRPCGELGRALQVRDRRQDVLTAHGPATAPSSAAKSSSSASRYRCACAAKSARPTSRPELRAAHTAAAPHARSSACSIADPPGSAAPTLAATCGNDTTAAPSPAPRNTATALAIFSASALIVPSGMGSPRRRHLTPSPPTTARPSRAVPHDDTPAQPISPPRSRPSPDWRSPRRSRRPPCPRS